MEESMSTANTANTANAATGVTSAEARQATVELARWWWAWLVMGILWVIASMVILQFRQSSITLVGVVIGIMFVAAGLQEIITAYVSAGWRWLWAAFGTIFVIGGIYALFNPTQTFLVVADLLGALFALTGIFWVIEAFATVNVNRLWWLGLISGICMIGLGFWAAGQFTATKAYTLLVFAGIWALFHGLGDIVKAFAIKRAGAMVAA
jgi:uncharacterized membrane protein HdeD (DUF308 family)